MRRGLCRKLTQTGMISSLLFLAILLNAQCPNSATANACQGSDEIIVLADLIEGEEPGGLWTREEGIAGNFNAMNGTYTITADADSSIFLYTYNNPGMGPDPCEVEVTINVWTSQPYTLPCRQYSIGISDGNPDLIDADSLIVSTSVTCDKIIQVQARRLEMEAACGYSNNAILSDSVGFCCADIGDTIMVEVVTTFASGNQQMCMASVIVTDKLNPILIESPSDVTISCEYPLNIDNLSIFGGYAYWPSNSKTITINDPGQEINPTVTEGKIIENCPDNLVINERAEDLRDCGTGSVLRIISISDPGSSTVIQDTQVISVENYNPFIEDNISWPKDTMIESCDVLDGDVSLTGTPSFLVTNTCSMPMFTRGDKIYDDPNSGCIVIERTWKVMDWCQYDHRANTGVWIDRQYIKLKNTVAPTFDNFEDSLSICTPFGSCEGIMDIPLEVSDDCTAAENLWVNYKIDLYNDGGTEISGEGKIIQENLPRGEHKIYWYTEDRCGNGRDTAQVVTVRECKSPSPVCLQGIAISLSTDGEVEIWASDFDSSSNDNCTSRGNLKFSFSDDPEDGFLLLDCEDIGLVDLEVWVTDEDGNQAYCLTSVDVQDNLNGCQDGNQRQGPIAAMISGAVFSELQTPIEDAQINISGPEFEDYQMTHDGGLYAFENLPAQYEYEIIPTKDDYPLAGVNTLDLLKIQRHILGIKSLDSPYKMIAADINNSQNITAGDLIQLRKLILGVHDHFPENNSWRFVETKFGLLEEENPWPFVEGMMIPNLTQDVISGDFIGIKIGDVDNTVEDNLRQRNIGTRSTKEMVIAIEDIKLERGAITDVTLTSKGIQKLIALQWTITFDDEKIEIVNWGFNHIPMSNDDVAIISGEGMHFTTAWNSIEPLFVGSGDELLTLTIKASDDVQLSEVLQFGSTITPAVAYNDMEEELRLQVEWNHNFGDIVLYQNAPNPFIDRTTIAFDMPQEGQASFSIADVSGRILHQNTANYRAGKNEIQVNASELRVPAGVLYYTLTYADKQVTKKMLLLK